MSVPRKIFVLALAFGATKLPLIAQTPPGTTSEAPSILRTFLRNTRNASVRTRTLGTLKGLDNSTATFAAVVAWDPDQPEKEIRGLTVQLKDQKKDTTIYIDDDRNEGGPQDSLEDFQDGLSVLLDDLDKIPGKALHSNARDAFSETTSPENGRYGKGDFPSVDVLNIGWWYQRGHHPAVVIECRFRAETDCPQHGQMYFPNTNLRRVIDLVKRGRDFLEGSRGTE